MTSTAAAAERRWVRPGTEDDDIQIDAEFEGLIPPLSHGERAGLHRSLDAEGCQDDLVVWQGRRILVCGHNRICYCREKGYPFPVLEKEFADREAVKAYIYEEQGRRRNLSAVAESYVRGKRYHDVKKPHGGARNGDGASAHGAHLKTDEILAKVYGVDHSTIRRDGDLAKAVDEIAQNCGKDAGEIKEVRDVLLSRDSGLRRGGIIHLAGLTVEEQKEFIEKLKEKGKPPRKPRKKGSTMTVPSEPEPLLQFLVMKLSPEVRAFLVQGLLEAKDKPAAEGISGENGASEGVTIASAPAETNGLRGGRGKRGSKKSGNQMMAGAG